MPKNQVMNFQLDLSTELTSDFLAISAENGMQPEEFANYIIKNYLSKSAILPPPAEVVVEQLQEVRHEFEKENIVHLSLFGSVARNEAKRGSDIDLLAEFSCLVGMKKWGKSIDIAQKKLGEKFKIDLIPKKFLRENAYESALNDAIKIF